MAGSLYHGKQFKKVEYRGNDGRLHHELAPQEGGSEPISISNWRELCAYCERFGISPAEWPQYQSGIDVPVEEVRAMNELLRDRVRLIPPAAAAHLYWLERIVGYMQREEMILFCEE